jgi:hypothetical protein
MRQRSVSSPWMNNCFSNREFCCEIASRLIKHRKKRVEVFFILLNYKKKRYIHKCYSPNQNLWATFFTVLLGFFSLSHLIICGLKHSALFDSSEGHYLFSTFTISYHLTGFLLYLFHYFCFSAKKNDVIKLISSMRSL